MGLLSYRGTRRGSTGCPGLSWPVSTSVSRLLPERKSFFKIPAPRAPRAPAKARRNSVQLWKAGHFWEIISAPLLPRFCPFCPRRDRFRDEMGAPEHPASVTFVRLDSEGLPYGVVESAGAVGTEAVEGATVLSYSMELESGLLSMVHAPSGLGWIGRVNRCTEQIIAAGS